MEIDSVGGGSWCSADDLSGSVVARVDLEEAREDGGGERKRGQSVICF